MRKKNMVFTKLFHSIKTLKLFTHSFAPWSVLYNSQCCIFNISYRFVQLWLNVVIWLNQSFGRKLFSNSWKCPKGNWSVSKAVSNSAVHFEVITSRLNDPYDCSTGFGGNRVKFIVLWNETTHNSAIPNQSAIGPTSFMSAQRIDPLGRHDRCRADGTFCKFTFGSLWVCFP